MVTRLPRVRATFELLYDAAWSWVDERALRLSAGVAYYALFALVPVLFLAISMASFFLGQAVRDDVEERIVGMLGADFAVALLEAIDAVEVGGATVGSTLVGFGIVLFAATLLFVAWKEVVDLLWGIPRERGVRASATRRLFGVAAVLGAGALLTLNIGVGSLVGLVGEWFDGPLATTLLRLTGSVAAFTFGTLSIALLFRHTPDAEVSWRHVWFAALVSMGMVRLGAWGYGLYLDRFGFESAVGVAGSALLGLVLVYYGAAILLYGMEIVRHAHEGDRFVPLALDLRPIGAPEPR